LGKNPLYLVLLDSSWAKMVKSVGAYDLYRTLGEGAYGKVKYGVHKESKEPVAIKVSVLLLFFAKKTSCTVTQFSY